MEKSLYVAVPEKFQSALKQRFNFCNAAFAISRMVIDASCPLCKEYKQCKNCPFHVFVNAGKNQKEVGCLVWMRLVLGGERKFNCGPMTVSWDRKDDAVVKTQLQLLNKEAEKYIVWVD